VRHYARRHLLDTVGVMIAGAGGEVATRAEAVLSAVRPAGRIPVPGRARRADLIDAAFLGGTAAHGIELDDGFRQGSVHPGCVVVPAVLALGYDRRITGAALIEAVVAGYEAEIAIGRACHPDLRQRGFHPAAAVGVFGSVMAAGKLRGLPAGQLANALGIAASSAAGLFAFVNGGADIKRLHAGHASREGLQAALLAEQGVEGPPDVIEARDGFMQAFAFGRADKARAALASEASGQRGHSISARAGHSPEPGSSARAEQGMLEMKCPAMMNGYHNRPDVRPPFTTDGYYVTGDVFRRDAEGFHYFVGRTDDMFVSGGENIYPADVERMLEHHLEIAQAAVVPIDDEIKGQKPVAFVVLKPGRHPIDEDIKRFALANAPAYQHPRFVWFVDELPLASTNKVDRVLLHRMAEERIKSAG